MYLKSECCELEVEMAESGGRRQSSVGGKARGTVGVDQWSKSPLYTINRLPLDRDKKERKKKRCKR